ncbi:SDR family oxidoreductase [Candidatus Pelagibacter sp.]|nr:SDR family oxidoreductase [Candidatus Pelagibacter sp.]
MSENKYILITGTSKGIGENLSKTYLERNYKVIGCSRSGSNFDHKNYTHFKVDITDEKHVVNVFSKIRKMIDGKLYLINNAGVASMNHSLTTPGISVEKILKTNVLGTFLFCREAAKIMKKNNFGRIVNLTSIATPLSLEGESIYAASKSSINSLTKTLSKEFADFGITVNAIGPTPIDTNLIKNVPKDKITNLISKLTLKRMGVFEDVSNVIDFYIKDESNYITGQTIYLGGVN